MSAAFSASHDIEPPAELGFLRGGGLATRLNSGARLERASARSGYAGQATVLDDFLGEGMELVSKPFDLDALAAAVRRMLG